MFTDTATIAITIALSVSLLLLTYIILVLALSYKKSKMDVRKKDISKRSTFKKSDKKEKRRKLQPGLNSDLSEPDSDSDLIMSKKEKQRSGNSETTTEGSMRTVGDYLNQMENGYNNDNNVIEEKVSADFNKDLNANEAEDAEEWTPSLVSDDEIEAYMKEQYAWMEENRPENELSMSLIFGGEENSQYEETPDAYHPEVLEKSEEVKDIKAKGSEGRARKLTGEPHEIEIEIEELTEYPEEQTADYDALQAAQANPQMHTEEEMPEKQRLRKRRLRQGRDEAEALQDWVNAKSFESERKKQLDAEEFTEEAYNVAEADTSEQPDSIIAISYNEESSAENINNSVGEELEFENNPDSEEYLGEYYEESDQPFDFTQTLEQAITRGEQRQSEASEPENYEEQFISADSDEYNEEPAEVLFEPAFADMLSDEEDDVLSIEEAEEYAQNFFENSITEPVGGSAQDEVSEQFEETVIEPVVVEEKLTMPEMKEAELAELARLVAQKNYPDAMKKVFSILNAGYVMTPDEKQKMRLVMLTLKAKT